MFLHTNVLVLGSGVAGCRAAVEAADCGAEVTLASAGRLAEGGSTFYPLTHGIGYGVALGEPDSDDSLATHWQDIMAAGLGLVDPRLACILVYEAPTRWLDLVSYGVRFKGKTLERGFPPCFGSKVRGLLVPNLDNLHSALVEQVRRRNVRVLEGTTALELLSGSHRCYGAILLGREGELYTVQAGSVVLATGGASALFHRHMATPELLGVGHAMAAELGAGLINMEFQQVLWGMMHPHAGMIFPHSFFALEPRLTDGRGQDLLDGLDAREVLQARATHGPYTTSDISGHLDVRAYQAMLNGGDQASPHGGIWAEFDGISAVKFRDLNPHWCRFAKNQMVDLKRSRFELGLFVQAFNGGVYISPEGWTGVPGLYACGEVAGGMHGANRVGGSRFADTQVFGARAGRYAALASRRQTKQQGADVSQVRVVRKRIADISRSSSGVPPALVLGQIRRVMWEHVALQRNASGLQQALEHLRELEKEALPRMGGLKEQGELPLAMSLAHALRTSQAIVQAALWREETRGPHFREDFPESRLDPPEACLLQWNGSGWQLSSWSLDATSCPDKMQHSLPNGTEYLRG